MHGHTNVKFVKFNVFTSVALLVAMSVISIHLHAFSTAEYSWRLESDAVYSVQFYGRFGRLYVVTV
jgi:hypothetical protein